MENYDDLKINGHRGDVIESVDYASLPVTGLRSRLYITLNNNNTYRWDGAAYQPITSSSMTSYSAGPGLTLSGTTFSVNIGTGLTMSDGTLSIATASSVGIGGIIVGTGLTISNTGLLSVSNSSTSYTTGTGLTLSGSTFSLITTNYKVIYVSVNGNDLNNGLNELMPVLNLWKARDLVVSGDTVMVMPGSYIFDNRNSAGCPYNGLVESKVNLWKDGVSYHFMPGVKIYSYGSTSGSYSPYSDDMVYFRPNSLTYSQCTITGELEFYANSEGADNSGGNHILFDGGESNGVSTYPGYTFYMNAKHIEGVTGCTSLRAVRTSIGAGTASIYIDVKTLKYGYTTGQSANACFTTWRGGDNSEMIVNIRIGQIIGNGTTWLPVFQVRTYSTSGINKLKVSIDIKSASMLGHSYLLLLSGGTALISSGRINFNCDSCIFSPSLFWLLQTFKNYYLTITGNYYCSGFFTGKYTFFPSTYPFIALWDQTNDSITDNTVLDFKGNYYTNHPTRTMVHVGGYGAGLPYGPTNNIGNFTGDIYFNGTSSNYTGNLFYVEDGKLRFSGRIHGTKNYSNFGFNGSVIKFGNAPSSVVMTNTYIHSDLDSSLVAYGAPIGGQNTLTISNSFIDMTGTSSVIADLRNVNTYIQNSTIRNSGTNDILSNTLSNGSLQITNSTLINLSSTATTINYPLGTVIGAGVFSNKEIIVSTLSGTVSVVSALV